MIDNITEIETSELFKRYANACNTYYFAGGHGKTHYNKAYAKHYAEELESRGETVPEMNVASKFGIFNGKGSY